MGVEQQEKLVVIKVLYSLSFVVAVSIHRARLGETSGVCCFQFRCTGGKKDTVMCPQAFYFGRKVLKRKGLFGSTHEAQDEVQALLK